MSEDKDLVVGPIEEDGEDEVDLLSLLEQANDEPSELDKAMSSEDSAEADKKMTELRELAQSLDTPVVQTNNPGSGNLDTDLANWFRGEDVLPSDPLTAYTSGAGAKMSYGISKSTLTNYEMMGKLGQFIDSAMEFAFSENILGGLDPDDLMDRMKTAFTMYKDLATLNSRTVLALAEQRNKFDKEGQDTDRLSMLLASIPSDKLAQILTELSTKK